MHAERVGDQIIMLRVAHIVSVNRMARADLISHSGRKKKWFHRARGLEPIIIFNAAQLSYHS